MMKCKICNTEICTFANAIILNKYNINYFQCLNCRFIQTEEPYWLEEAYTEAIAASDVGLVSRNILLSQLSSKVVLNFFDRNAKFLDYGGGYGLFVRLMRDKGFDFYWEDKFCKNIFSKGFELENQVNEFYELVTAFEVFEHFINPIQEIESILRYSKNILFSTELLPDSNPRPNEWWYYALDEGQHISIYTKKSLLIIAEKFNLNLYSDGRALHLLTEKNLSTLPFVLDSLDRDEPLAFNKASLIQRDYLKATGQLSDSKIDSISMKTEDKSKPKKAREGIKIVVDGVFFQFYKTGIARVWQSLLEEWANNGFSKHVVVLDRARTAPQISGVQYRAIPPYDYSKTDADREMLQQVCDEEAADLFISTYYTTPLSTPSVFMAYDMIPEVLEWNLEIPMWKEKHYSIQQACAYIAISDNTGRDLVKFFPDISLDSVTVAHCGVKQTFYPAGLEEINDFRTRYGIVKPYFITVGASSGYKNTILFFKAFAQLCSKSGFDIVCTGSGSILEDEFRVYTSGSVVHMLQLRDEELRAAYSGSVALVYPSLYEGFGLPVLEAIACGCPVITCPNASIPEVAGEAALYVKGDDVEELANALCEVQKPIVRQSLISAGLEQAKKFSWSKMAKTISATLIQASLEPLKLKDNNLIVFPDWTQPEEVLSWDLERVIKPIATHPDRSHITLLVDTSGISEDDANLLLSGIVMNLLMQEELDVTEGVEISLVGQLGELQWEALLPRLHARVVLEHENQQMIARSGAETLPTCELTQ